MDVLPVILYAAAVIAVFRVATIIRDDRANYRATYRRRMGLKP